MTTLRSREDFRSGHRGRATTNERNTPRSPANDTASGHGTQTAPMTHGQQMRRALLVTGAPWRTEVADALGALVPDIDVRTITELARDSDGYDQSRALFIDI